MKANKAGASAKAGKAEKTEPGVAAADDLVLKLIDFAELLAPFQQALKELPDYDSYHDPLARHDKLEDLRLAFARIKTIGAEDFAPDTQLPVGNGEFILFKDLDPVNYGQLFYQQQLSNFSDLVLSKTSEFKQRAQDLNNAMIPAAQRFNALADLIFEIEVVAEQFAAMLRLLQKNYEPGFVDVATANNNISFVSIHLIICMANSLVDLLLLPLVSHHKVARKYIPENTFRSADSFLVKIIDLINTNPDFGFAKALMFDLNRKRQDLNSFIRTGFTKKLAVKKQHMIATNPITAPFAPFMAAVRQMNEMIRTDAYAATIKAANQALSLIPEIARGTTCGIEIYEIKAVAYFKYHEQNPELKWLFKALEQYRATEARYDAIPRSRLDAEFLGCIRSGNNYVNRLPNNINALYKKFAKRLVVLERSYKSKVDPSPEQCKKFLHAKLQLISAMSDCQKFMRNHYARKLSVAKNTGFRKTIPNFAVFEQEHKDLMRTAITLMLQYEPVIKQIEAAIAAIDAEQARAAELMPQQEAAAEAAATVAEQQAAEQEAYQALAKENAIKRTQRYQSRMDQAKHRANVAGGQAASLAGPSLATTKATKKRKKKKKLSKSAQLLTKARQAMIAFNYDDAWELAEQLHRRCNGNVIYQVEAALAKVGVCFYRALDFAASDYWQAVQEYRMAIEMLDTALRRLSTVTSQQPNMQQHSDLLNEAIAADVSAAKNEITKLEQAAQRRLEILQKKHERQVAERDAAKARLGDKWVQGKSGTSVSVYTQERLATEAEIDDLEASLLHFDMCGQKLAGIAQRGAPASQQPKALPPGMLKLEPRAVLAAHSPSITPGYKKAGAAGSAGLTNSDGAKAKTKHKRRG